MILTQEQKVLLQGIKGTSGGVLLEGLINEKIKELDSVSSLDENTLSNFEARCLGRKYAVELLREFLSDLNFMDKPVKKSNTYE